MADGSQVSGPASDVHGAGRANEEDPQRAGRDDGVPSVTSAGSGSDIVLRTHGDLVRSALSPSLLLAGTLDYVYSRPIAWRRLTSRARPAPGRLPLAMRHANGDRHSCTVPDI